MMLTALAVEHIAASANRKIVPLQGPTVSCRLNDLLLLRAHDCDDAWFIGLLWLILIALTVIGLVTVIIVSIAYTRSRRRKVGLKAATRS